MNLADPPFFPKDVMAAIGITHPNTLRLKIQRGEIPEPDVKLTQKNRYWFRSTLVKAGILKAEPSSSPEPASLPTPAE